MTKGLERRYGQNDLYVITCSCYQRRPLLAAPRARDVFLEILDNVRKRYAFALVGYVVMPEHVHLLMSESTAATPSIVMQVLKQDVSRALQRGAPSESRVFWQPRFYDFNVWTRKKRNEKLNYIHLNPVKRGLVDDPKMSPWSSYRFYRYGEECLCTPDPGPQ
jgi:putative transposase